MSRLQLVGRYVGFAIIATLANLLVQRAVLVFGDSADYFALAVLSGTAVGLATKFLLDKRWIFFDVDTSLVGNSRKFFLYSLMGVVTTIIFWVTESAFWLVWQTQAMRELGAILGLAIGYAIKYRLDSAFVFRTAPPSRKEG